ncbi:phosphotransferase enzyme family protein [Thermoflavimicrobium daqui]|jgi:Ser/Thr protein kinase RdoA (MazF antagonist)|uniref:Aminoglycoside phosphotransferase domain-containing protein n=1 Tax=Thermoflavimicrobium daqui TaxID=2137476 RepID=A0A364K455_9BACL|nr:phosphotransferase [Thermoflavimicrobium daqui]RAL24117.1 hypothetical protein DL897_10525 [Thermoflavimicrobium daqui]
MILEIQKQFNENILQMAAQCYGVQPKDLISLGGFESHVYEFVYQQKPCIMKITHSLRRTKDYIMGELDFLNFLIDRGANVARALPSSYGNWVEIIPTGQTDSYFLVIVYEKAKGKLPTEAEWNHHLFETWGQTLGKIHAISKEYKLPNSAFKRQEWNEEDQLDIAKYVPNSQTKVFEQVEKLMDRIASLPKDRNSYGLIHGDFHHKNFFVENGIITVFDFDDVTYNWYINDIATILYFVNMHPLKPWVKEFPRCFLDPFLIGYCRENQLDPIWFKYLPDFLRLNHVIQYVICYQSLDMEKLTKAQKHRIEKLRYEIENEVEILNIPDTYANTKKY